MPNEDGVGFSTCELTRRSIANNNKPQSKALFTTTTYSFESHSRTKTFHMLDTKTGKISIALDDPSASEVYWFGSGGSIAYLKPSSGIVGGTDLWICNGTSQNDLYGIL